MSNRKRIMLLGAGDEHVHVVRAAKYAGHYVIVVDPNSTRPGVALADDYVQLDLLDEEAVVKAARDRRIDGITTASLGIGMRTIGAVAEALDLPGLRRDSAYAVTDKITMRERLHTAGVDSVSFGIAASVDEALQCATELGLPVVTKPPDGSGSRGVRVVSRADDIAEAYQAAVAQTRSPERIGQVLVEAFVPGHEINADGFVIEGQTHTPSLRESIMTPPPYRQEVAYRFPASLASTTQTAVENLLGQTMQALRLNQTAFNVDMKIKPDGTPALIEIGARLPGYGLSFDFIPHATGLDMAAINVELALGGAPDLTTTMCRPTCMFFLRPKTGKITSGIDLEGLRQQPGVVAAQSKLCPGDSVSAITDGIAALHYGYVVTTADSTVDACQLAQLAADWFCDQLVYDYEE
ncbi:MAG: ATP-grasp domain-containing protein [Chloroflexi bacterium]|nr:ATP-grasp domain-containing protein [Chloroflexota bacterium]